MRSGNARAFDLVAQLRLSIATIALLAIVVVVLSIVALYQIGRAREELIDVNLPFLLDLDTLKSDLPDIVQSVLSDAVGDDGPEADATGPDRRNDLLEKLLTHATATRRWQSDPLVGELPERVEALHDGLRRLQAGRLELVQARALSATAVQRFAKDLPANQELAARMREEADFALKSGSQPGDKEVRNYVLMEHIVRDLGTIDADFHAMLAATTTVELEKRVNLLRNDLRDLTYNLARLPDSAHRKSLVQAIAALRSTVLDADVLKSLQGAVLVQARQAEMRESLLLQVSGLQENLTGLTRIQAGLVQERGRVLTDLTRWLNGLLIVLGLGVCVITGLTWYFILERRISQRIKILSDNLSILLSGKDQRLTLPGPDDELVRINAALEALRRHGIERDRLEEDLRRMMTEARASAESKSMFLSTMSHEVRTPLNAIIGMFELIEAADIPDRQRRRAASGRSAAEKLLALLTNVLDASRLESDALRLATQEIDANELRDDLATALEGAEAKAGGRVAGILDWHSSVPERIRVDPYRLRQIIFNLIDNAFKFTESGSVIVSVFREASDDRGLAILVKDTGVGIPAEQHGSVFEAFRQVDGGTKRRVGGSGLGLSIASALTKLMGAKLTLNSEPGVGSEFILRLPDVRVGDSEMVGQQ